MATSILSCPLCCRQELGTVEALREHLLYFVYRPIPCPVCRTPITGLQQLVHHLDVHLQCLQLDNIAGPNLVSSIMSSVPHLRDVSVVVPESELLNMQDIFVARSAVVSQESEVSSMKKSAPNGFSVVDSLVNSGKNPLVQLDLLSVQKELAGTSESHNACVQKFHNEFYSNNIHQVGHEPPTVEENTGVNIERSLSVSPCHTPSEPSVQILTSATELIMTPLILLPSPNVSSVSDVHQASQDSAMNRLYVPGKGAADFIDNMQQSSAQNPADNVLENSRSAHGGDDRHLSRSNETPQDASAPPADNVPPNCLLTDTLGADQERFQWTSSPKKQKISSVQPLAGHSTQNAWQPSVHAYVCSMCSAKIVGQELYFKHLQEHSDGVQNNVPQAPRSKGLDSDVSICTSTSLESSGNSFNSSIMCNQKLVADKLESNSCSEIALDKNDRVNCNPNSFTDESFVATVEVRYPLLCQNSGQPLPEASDQRKNLKNFSDDPIDGEETVIISKCNSTADGQEKECRNVDCSSNDEFSDFDNASLDENSCFDYESDSFLPSSNIAKNPNATNNVMSSTSDEYGLCGTADQTTIDNILSVKPQTKKSRNMYLHKKFHHEQKTVVHGREDEDGGRCFIPDIQSVWVSRLNASIAPEEYKETSLSTQTKIGRDNNYSDNKSLENGVASRDAIDDARDASLLINRDDHMLDHQFPENQLQGDSSQSTSDKANSPNSVPSHGVPALESSSGQHQNRIASSSQEKYVMCATGSTLRWANSKENIISYNDISDNVPLIPTEETGSQRENLPTASLSNALLPSVDLCSDGDTFPNASILSVVDSVSQNTGSEIVQHQSNQRHVVPIMNNEKNPALQKITLVVSQECPEKLTLPEPNLLIRNVSIDSSPELQESNSLPCTKNSSKNRASPAAVKKPSFAHSSFAFDSSHQDDEHVLRNIQNKSNFLLKEDHRGMAAVKESVHENISPLGNMSIKPVESNPDILPLNDPESGVGERSEMFSSAEDSAENRFLMVSSEKNFSANLVGDDAMKCLGKKENNTNDISCSSDGRVNESINSSPSSKSDTLPSRHHCRECSKTFLNVGNFRRHTREVHNSAREFSCTVCSRTFCSFRQLVNHRGVHDTQKKFHCNLCDHHCYTSAGIRSHKFQEHKKEKLVAKPFKCDQCNESFARNFGLQRHMRRKHSEKQYSCPHCAKSYSCYENLQSHVTSHVVDETHIRFYCSPCNTQYKSKFALKRHLSIRHPLSLDHNRDQHVEPCPEDDRSSLRNSSEEMCSSLENMSPKHDSSSSTLLKSCPESTVPNPLELAAGNEQTGKLIWSNPVVNNRFLQAAQSRLSSISCKKEILTLNSSLHNEASTSKANDISAKPAAKFTCSVCSHTFTRKDTLKVHMQSHSSERLFSCNLCDMTFKRRSILVTHQNKHKAIASYHCQLCDKRFRFKISLKHHSCTSRLD